MSRPLSYAFKDLKEKVETTFKNLPWKMDPRTKRSLGRCVQFLTASRSSRLSKWAVSAKNRLKKPISPPFTRSRQKSGLDFQTSKSLESKLLCGLFTPPAHTIR